MNLSSLILLNEKMFPENSTLLILHVRDFF